MQVDISFQFAKVYDISRADVVAGQKFSLITGYTGKWFSDNDPVLGIKVTGMNAEVEALTIGDATILIMNDTFGIEKTLTIRVVDAIVEPAADLGLTAGEPEIK